MTAVAHITYDSLDQVGNIADERTDNNLPNSITKMPVPLESWTKSCDWCREWSQQQCWAVDPGLPFPIYASELKKYYLRLCHHENDVHGTAHVFPTHTGNGRHNGEWAFTLTMSPTDGYTTEDMLTAVQKIVSQSSCPVKKYAWYLEHKQDESHPHVHGIYETDTGGRIEAKHFRRAWPLWNEKIKLGAGFKGGYHRPVITSDEYQKYISKDSQTAKGKFAFKGYPEIQI